MTLILLLYCVGIPLAAIFLSAPDDKGQIDRGETIEHKSQWLERVGIALAAAAMVCYALIVRFDQSPWVVGPVALGAWPLFSLPFNLSLNARRKYDWRYMSPWSNTYDKAFWWVACRLTNKMFVYHSTFVFLNDGDLVQKWFVQMAKRDIKASSMLLPFRVATPIKTLFELLLFALCCWWMAQIVNP